VRAVGRWSLLRGDALFASGSTTEAPPSSPLDAHPLTRTAAATTFQEPRSKIKNRAAKGSPGKGRNGNGLEAHTTETDEFLARQLLRRTGVVFRRTLEREKAPITWSALIRVYRRLELRGEIRGGRFVAGFTGEQYALPEAVELLRRLRREGPREPISVASADPLNFQGILTPAQRVAPTTRRQVLVG
jgi:hypothetical protein